MPEFNLTHFTTHLEKVVRDAEHGSGSLKSLVRAIVFVAQCAPPELRGLEMFKFVDLALRTHKKVAAEKTAAAAAAAIATGGAAPAPVQAYTADEFGHVVRAYAAIDAGRAMTLSHNKNLSP